MSKNNTIGFFGDSFCAEQTNHHSLYYGYKTYIKLLAEHYDAKVVNLGVGGSGVWDTLLLQLKPFIESNTVPDICVFVWTIPGRLFNRKVRRLNSTDVDVKWKLTNRDIWQAGKLFYNHLYDQEKEELEYLSFLRYVDQVVLPKIPSTSKIVHLWTAGSTTSWTKEGIRPSNITYPYEWTIGSEVRPSLLSLSMYDNDLEILSNDHRCNHLDGDFKNETLFSWLKLAIDNPNSFWDYTIIADKLYDRH
jgi:hypothetical protein